MPSDLLQARYSNIGHFSYDMDVLKKEMIRLKDLWGVGRISLAVALHSILEKYAKGNGMVHDDGETLIPMYYDVDYLSEWKENLDMIYKIPKRFEWAEEIMREVLKVKKDEDSLRLYKTYTKEEKIEFIRSIYNNIVNEFNNWKEENVKKDN